MRLHSQVFARTLLHKNKLSVLKQMTEKVLHTNRDELSEAEARAAVLAEKRDSSFEVHKTSSA